MTNPFKELKSEEEVPKHLKKKVMKSVNYAKFLVDVTDLFSMKYVETLGKLFETEEGREKSNDEKYKFD